MPSHKKKISHYFGDQKARYLLATEGDRPLLVIGLNPSKADAQRSDQTFSKVLGFAERAGYDGIIMANLYPQRATQPSKLHLHKNTRLHQQNLFHLEAILQRYPGISILAAWGANLEKRKYLTACLQDIDTLSQKYACKWLQIGSLTKKGHPRHPSRTAYSQALSAFDLGHYIQHHTANT